MFDMTVDCDQFSDKKVRKRCEKRNETINEYAEEIAYSNNVIEKGIKRRELLKKKIADYTMRKKRPPQEITNELSQLNQRIEMLRHDRAVKKSERDIRVTEIDLDADEGKLYEEVKQILKKRGMDLSNRAKVQEILKEIRSSYSQEADLMSFGGRVGATVQPTDSEPSIRELLEYESMDIPLHPEWEKKLREYKSKKGIKSDNSSDEEDVLDLEDLS